MLNLMVLVPLIKRAYTSFGINCIMVLWLIEDLLADFGNKRAWILNDPNVIEKSKVMRMIRAAAFPSVVSTTLQCLVDK